MTSRCVRCGACCSISADVRSLDDVNAPWKARGHAVTLLDPRETEGGFFMQLMEKAYFHYKPDDDDHPPEELQRVAAVVQEADAYVIVSPEYNHQPPPGLTNLMSYFGASAYKYKPSAMVTYSAGNWGGVRAAVGLRSYLGELGCIAVSACRNRFQARIFSRTLMGCFVAFEEGGTKQPIGDLSVQWPAALAFC